MRLYRDSKESRAFCRILPCASPPSYGLRSELSSRYCAPADASTWVSASYASVLLVTDVGDTYFGYLESRDVNVRDLPTARAGAPPIAEVARALLGDAAVATTAAAGAAPAMLCVEDMRATLEGEILDCAVEVSTPAATAPHVYGSAALGAGRPQIARLRLFSGSHDNRASLREVGGLFVRAAATLAGAGDAISAARARTLDAEAAGVEARSALDRHLATRGAREEELFSAFAAVINEKKDALRALHGELEEERRAVVSARADAAAAAAEVRLLNGHILQLRSQVSSSAAAGAVVPAVELGGTGGGGGGGGTRSSRMRSRSEVFDGDGASVSSYEAEEAEDSAGDEGEDDATVLSFSESDDGRRAGDKIAEVGAGAGVGVGAGTGGVEPTGPTRASQDLRGGPLDDWE